MMGSSFRCYIPSFVKIGPPVPQEIFKVITIYERSGNLGNVTWTIYTNFGFGLHIKFGFDRPSGFGAEDV